MYDDNSCFELIDNENFQSVESKLRTIFGSRNLHNLSLSVNRRPYLDQIFSHLQYKSAQKYTDTISLELCREENTSIAVELTNLIPFLFMSENCIIELHTGSYSSQIFSVDLELYNQRDSISEAICNPEYAIYLGIIWWDMLCKFQNRFQQSVVDPNSFLIQTFNENAGTKVSTYETSVQSLDYDVRSKNYGTSIMKLFLSTSRMPSPGFMI